MVFNVLAFMLKAKALIKQLQEWDYKSMNVSGKVSHMSLCNNKGLKRECGDWAEQDSSYFFIEDKKTGAKANK